MSELDAVILDLVESKKISIAALRFIFLRKNQFKRTSLNRAFIIFMSLNELLFYNKTIIIRIELNDIFYFRLFNNSLTSEVRHEIREVMPIKLIMKLLTLTPKLRFLSRKTFFL